MHDLQKKIVIEDIYHRVVMMKLLLMVQLHILEQQVEINHYNNLQNNKFYSLQKKIILFKRKHNKWKDQLNWLMFQMLIIKLED